MKYVYIEGWAGNGFEDDGVGVGEVKLFDDKTQALAYSGERFCKFAIEYLGEGEIDDMSVYEMADLLNGTIDVDTGYWSCQPESTSYGLIKEIA